MVFTQHKTHARTAVFAVAVACAAGCVPNAARQGTRPVEGLLATRGIAAPSWSAADSAAASSIPVGALAAEQAVRIALVRSPHVRAVLADVGIASADLWQASRLPNPVVNLLAGAPTKSGAGVSSVGVGFAIVSALQRPLRQRIAAAELRGVEQRVADAVVTVVVQVQRAYVDVQHAQQSLELTQTIAAATAASAGAARAIQAAGNLAALAVANEEAMASQSTANVTESEIALEAARAELGRLLGARVADTAWTIGDRLADPLPEQWSLSALDSLALARRLDIAGARASAQAAFSTVGLEKGFRLLPDGTIGAFVEGEPDGKFVGGNASIVLPVFDGGGARVARARAVLQKRSAEHDALVVDAHAAVRTAWARYEGSRRRAVQLRTSVLPARRRVLVESQLQVNAMAMPVFALLQAKQAEIDAAHMYLDALRDYWSARAELERATGGMLPARSGS
jgi:cobalt-zinc-cadmium efflux system outer membrane protein